MSGRPELNPADRPSGRRAGQRESLMPRSGQTALLQPNAGLARSPGGRTSPAVAARSASACASRLRMSFSSPLNAVQAASPASARARRAAYRRRSPPRGPQTELRMTCRWSRASTAHPSSRPRAPPRSRRARPPQRPPRPRPSRRREAARHPRPALQLRRCRHDSPRPGRDASRRPNSPRSARGSRTVLRRRCPPDQPRPGHHRRRRVSPARPRRYRPFEESLLRDPDPREIAFGHIVHAPSQHHRLDARSMRLEGSVTAICPTRYAEDRESFYTAGRTAITRSAAATAADADRTA